MVPKALPDDGTGRPVTHGVLTLTGYGLRLAVERGHLVVEDGVGHARRRARFSRVDRDLKRVVIIGHSGTVTLDAIAWLHGVGVPLIHLDHDARVYFVSTPSPLALAQLRRAQALAAGDEKGLAISRALVASKVEGQLAVLAHMPDSTAAGARLAEAVDQIQRAPTVKVLRAWEAKAAQAYWRLWRMIPLQFAEADAKRRPAHWQTFGSRRSLLSRSSPRKAVNPANAILNYLYAILEAEATIAAHAARLDPTVGFLHADHQERRSLAHDLMEPIRPRVDAFALSMFRERRFTKDDAFERADGHCRLLPPLTQDLAATASLWASQVYPIAVEVAKALATRHKPKNLVPGVPKPRVGAKRGPRSYTSIVRRFYGTPAATWIEFQRMTGEHKGGHATP